jgi:hypothetical protein
VTCIPTLSNEYGNTPSPVMLGSGLTQVATETLPGSHAGQSYIVLGNVRVSASGTQSADVTCSLSLAGSTGTQGDYTADLDGSSSNAAGTIPLVLPVVISGSPQTVGIGCSQTPSPPASAPSVTVTAAVNAIQTASNN